MFSEYEEGYLAGQNTRSGNPYQNSHHNGAALGALLGGLLVLLVRLVPTLWRLALVVLPLVPVFVLGLAATSWLPALGNVRLLLSAAVAYGLHLVVYYLKGRAIAAHQRGGRWPLAFWLSLALGCLLPALVLYLALADELPVAADAALVYGLPVGLAGFAYYRYQFTTDYAPALVLWAYRLGFQAVAGRVNS